MKVNTGRSLYNEYMSTMKVDRALVSKQIQMEGDIMNLLLESKSPKLADATPLGLCGFAGTTFILSMMNAGVIVGRCKSETNFYLLIFNYENIFNFVILLP